MSTQGGFTVCTQGVYSVLPGGIACIGGGQGGYPRGVSKSAPRERLDCGLGLHTYTHMHKYTHKHTCIRYICASSCLAEPLQLNPPTLRDSGAKQLGPQAEGLPDCRNNSALPYWAWSRGPPCSLSLPG